ncbi:MAG: hypothetical protein IPO81_31230 [Kouleothrix sp.]|nr:hypothetical protein [Kouleothrix sp.]
MPLCGSGTGCCAWLPQPSSFLPPCVLAAAQDHQEQVSSLVASSQLTAVGIGCATWARVNIGRNWSSRPAMKEHHQLVTTGPYAYVRHPKRLVPFVW